MPNNPKLIERIRAVGVVPEGDEVNLMPHCLDYMRKRGITRDSHDALLGFAIVDFLTEWGPIVGTEDRRGMIDAAKYWAERARKGSVGGSRIKVRITAITTKKHKPDPIFARDKTVMSHRLIARFKRDNMEKLSQKNTKRADRIPRRTH